MTPDWRSAASKCSSSLICLALRRVHKLRRPDDDDESDIIITAISARFRSRSIDRSTTLEMKRNETKWCAVDQFAVESFSIWGYNDSIKYYRRRLGKRNLFLILIRSEILIRTLLRPIGKVLLVLSVTVA